MKIKIAKKRQEVPVFTSSEVIEEKKVKRRKKEAYEAGGGLKARENVEKGKQISIKAKQKKRVSSHCELPSVSAFLRRNCL